MAFIKRKETRLEQCGMQNGANAWQMTMDILARPLFTDSMT